MRKTREQAMQDLADVLAEGQALTASLTPREAAERAWHPSGPSVEELTQRIAKNRAEAASQAAQLVTT